MNYTHSIEEILGQYDEGLYKVIQLKFEQPNTKFKHGALSYGVQITDGVNAVDAFVVRISPDGKGLTTYFTIDAFGSFPDKGNAHLFYGDTLLGIVEDIDLQNINELPTVFSAIPHTVANNIWLASL